MTDERLPQSVRLIASRKLNRLRVGGSPPSAPLLIGDGIVHPTGITLVYGKGMAGKGWVCCYIIRALVEEGHRPIILDFEGYSGEWLWRLYHMGIRPDDMVDYIGPDGPLNLQMARDLGEAVADAEADYIIIDSVSASRIGLKDNDQGGADAANALFRAIAGLGAPALVVAHEPKGGKGPIGSVQYSNVPRLVYHAEGHGDDTTLQMEKANDRAMEDKPLTFSRILLPGGGVDLIRRVGDIVKQAKAEAAAESTTGAVLRILRERDRSMSADEVQVILGQEGSDIALSKVATIMRKLKMEGRLERVDRGRYAIPLPPEEKPELP